MKNNKLKLFKQENSNSDNLNINNLDQVHNEYQVQFVYTCYAVLLFIINYNLNIRLMYLNVHKVKIVVKGTIFVF